MPYSNNQMNVIMYQMQQPEKINTCRKCKWICHTLATQRASWRRPENTGLPPSAITGESLPVEKGGGRRGFRRDAEPAQNIAFSLVVKLAAVLLVFPGWLTLWLAILADMGASVLVTL